MTVREGRARASTPDAPDEAADALAIASETALAVDWDREEEEAAWAYLQ